jgi:hypothetical protein
MPHCRSMEMLSCNPSLVKAHEVPFDCSPQSFISGSPLNPRTASGGAASKSRVNFFCRLCCPLIRISQAFLKTHDAPPSLSLAVSWSCLSLKLMRVLAKHKTFSIACDDRRSCCKMRDQTLLLKSFEYYRLSWRACRLPASPSHDCSG